MAALRLARSFGSERGAELIEMAIVTPLLLFLMVGIVEAGFMFQRFVVLTNAAAEGARVGTLPGYGLDDAEARVVSYAANGGVQGVVNADAVAVTVPSGGGSWPGVQVTVTHEYTFQYIAPLAALISWSTDPSVVLSARSTMRSQVATASP